MESNFAAEFVGAVQDGDFATLPIAQKSVLIFISPTILIKNMRADESILETYYQYSETPLSVPPVPERNKDLARFFSPESLPEVAALIEDLDLEIDSIIPPQNA